MKYSVFASLLLIFCIIAPVAQAETFYDVSVSARDIIFQPDQPILSGDTQIYVTLRNNGTRNVEGSVIFSIDGKRLGVKPFSIRAAGSPEDVWIRWLPGELGPHIVRAEAVNDVNYPDANPADNVVSETMIVDLDTDGDGIPDRLDKDQDNDGLSNEQEKAQSTNPLRKDTDGDGVNDKEDFYPLDGTRTAYVAPVKPVAKPTTRVKTAPAPTVIKALVVVPRALGESVPLVPLEIATSSQVSTSSEFFAEETASSTVPVSENVVMSGSLQGAPFAGSPYRGLWALAGAAAGAAFGFVALDWWQTRRTRDDG